MRTYPSPWLVALALVGCAPTVCPAPDPSLIAQAVLTELAARDARAAAAGGDELADAEGDDDVAEDDGSVRVRVPIEGHPGLGGATPLVTIASFSDFQCPFCSRVTPTLERLTETYGDDLRIVFFELPLPFHPDAKPAAEAALEAYAQRGDAGYAAMRAQLYDHQRALGRADLERYAAEVGLDLARFRAALDDHRHLPTVEADLALAERVGARGTPNFFVNGRQVTGAQPYDVFDASVRAERAVARAAVASGVPRAQVYAHLMQDAVDRAVEAEVADAQPAPARPDPAATYALEIPSGTPGRGAREPLVTVVAFGDYECPFCQRAEATLQALLERYPDTVRVVHLQNPLGFHPHALESAMAAREAYAQRGEPGYFAMHAALYEAAAAHELSRSRLEAIAVSLRLDVRRFRRALDEGTHRARVEQEQALAARFGALGTPSFFINGRILTGARPLEEFTSLVDTELAEARALLESGVRRRDVYARVVRDGLPRFERE